MIRNVRPLTKIFYNHLNLSRTEMNFESLSLNFDLYTWVMWSVCVQNNASLYCRSANQIRKYKWAFSNFGTTQSKKTIHFNILISEQETTNSIIYTHEKIYFLLGFYGMYRRDIIKTAVLTSYKSVMLILFM